MKKAELTPDPSIPSLLEAAMKGTPHPLLQGAKLAKADAELQRRQAQNAAKRLKRTEEALRRKVEQLNIDQQKLKSRELELQKQALDKDAIQQMLLEKDKLNSEMELQLEELNQLVGQLKNQLRGQSTPEQRN